MGTEPTWDEIKAWRKTQRAELIARRAATDAAERARWNEHITGHLLAGYGIPEQAIVGFCWPYKGEFDARHAVRRWREQGASAALPEVVAKKSPLQFRSWWPGARMRPGVYDIPVPEDTEIVVPDIAIVPMNGFDEHGYRLGYGGAYFDRTLAALERRIVAIGVAYEMLRLPTIYPQPHDVPMDFVITEAGIYAASEGKLQRLEHADSRSRASRLMTARRLPRAEHASGYSSPACYGSEFPGYWGEDTEPKK
jgi:5-formyltetrahydrofolate cyclo-ligase